ncbi:short chain dehydrogenase [Serratia marcescens]|nr:short chain dehydrogenase [Serratia marcescens]CAI2095195.1 short chain dehydrogenase [Serratia marcescens]
MTIPDSPLKRQKLVILGGTSGIGAAVAYAAAARGAEVVLASRRLPHAGEKNDALHLMQADLTVKHHCIRCLPPSALSTIW